MSFPHRLLLSSALRVRQRTGIITIPSTITTPRLLHTFPPRLSNNNNENNHGRKVRNNVGGGGGSLARTDDSITVEYPEDHELPSSEPIVGAARHPTLATFSLEGNVGVVTGGARGLGLVMGQGMVVSGADLAIVDMNSKFFFLVFLFFLSLPLFTI